MKRSFVFGSAVLLYCLLQGSISYLLYERYKDNTMAHANNLTSKNVHVLQGLLDTFRPLPESIFSTLLDFEEFKIHVAEANDTSLSRKEHLRKVLFEAMRPIYEQTLQPKGFRQLQLHLENGERFLQLFDPLIYGDNSLPISSFETLNEPLVFAEGYSANSGDYHYYFPLFYKNKRIGVIEMSIPFEFFNKAAIKILDLKILKVLPTSFTKEDLAKISLTASEKSNLLLKELLLKQQSALILDDNSILSAFALLGANGKVSGYLASSKEDYVVLTLRSHFIEDTLISSILLVVMIILVLLYYRYVLLSSNIRSHDDATKARANALEKQNNFMHGLFQTIPSPAFLKNLNGEFIKCNEAFVNLFDKPADEIIGSKSSFLVDGNQKKKSLDVDTYVLNTQNSFSYEHCMKIAGEDRVFVIHKNALRNNGDILGIVGIMQEITERKKHQEKLECVISENKIQQAQLAHDNDIINRYAIFVKLNSNGTILDASEAMINICGFSKDELVGKTWYSFCKETKDFVDELQNQILIDGKWEGTLSFIRKDKNTYWLNCTVLTQVSQTKDEKSYIVFGTDVSNEVRIRNLSYMDDLTKIFNRRKFTESLENALRIIKRYPKEQSALIFFDIDNFKSVNDTHGHLVGDAILQELSSLVKNHLREVDTFARWGGEEFAIIAPKTDMQGALKITEKLRSLISNHYFKKAEHITCSFGVTEIKPSDTNDTLIERADEALYISKNKGKNRIEFLG